MNGKGKELTENKGMEGKLFSVLNAILLFRILRKALNTRIYREKPEE